MGIINGIVNASNILNGANQIAKIYNGSNIIWENWILYTGTYSSQTVNVVRFDSYQTFDILPSAVKPTKINISGELDQFDNPGTATINLDLYYETSGWVEVYATSHYIAAGGTWTFDIDVVVDDIGEVASQWRYKAYSRNNGNTNYLVITEWYAKGA